MGRDVVDFAVSFFPIYTPHRTTSGARRERGENRGATCRHSSALSLAVSPTTQRAATRAPRVHTQPGGDTVEENDPMTRQTPSLPLIPASPAQPQLGVTPGRDALAVAVR